MGLDQWVNEELSPPCGFILIQADERGYHGVARPEPKRWAWGVDDWFHAHRLGSERATLKGDKA